jgi:hypothetical protein
MPMLDGMQRRFHGQGLSVIGLSPESPRTIEAHLSLRPVTYTVGSDPGPTATRFGVRSLPTMVLVDRSGKVREVFVGVDRAIVTRLESRVRALIAEPAP